MDYTERLLLSQAIYDETKTYALGWHDKYRSVIIKGSYREIYHKYVSPRIYNNLVCQHYVKSSEEAINLISKIFRYKKDYIFIFGDYHFMYDIYKNLHGNEQHSHYIRSLVNPELLLQNSDQVHILC